MGRACGASAGSDEPRGGRTGPEQQGQQLQQAQVRRGRACRASAGSDTAGGGRTGP